ncbi:hypothetical protein BGZ94_007760 [Podila epigama]|nr:hypothetical protein BGZ94_007760 [Podila epigama]
MRLQDNNMDNLLANDLLGRNIPEHIVEPGVTGMAAYTRRILLTGGAGFIGSVLVRKLVLNYPEYFILVVDKLDYCSSLNNLKPFLEVSKQSQGRHGETVNHHHSTYSNFKFLQTDIIDAKAIEAAMKEYQINTVIHLAAQTHVDKSFGESIDFTKNNVLGTHVLLEAARKVFGLNAESIKASSKGSESRSTQQHPEPLFLFVSTDEVYGEVQFDQPDSREDAPLAPSNPYSATKAAAECMTQAYHKSFRLPVIITRSNNVYGPRQYPEKIFPKFIMNLHKEQNPSLDPTESTGTSGKCYIHGSGEHWRTYLYVTDAANALDVILHHGEVGKVYNIGGCEELNNLELAEYLVHKLVKDKVPNGVSNGVANGVSNGGVDGAANGAANRYESMKTSDETEAQSTLKEKKWEPTSLYSMHGQNKDANAAALAHLRECQACSSRIEFVEDRAFNDLRYAVDSTRLQRLGWAPRVRFSEGIEKTSK